MVPQRRAPRTNQQHSARSEEAQQVISKIENLSHWAAGLTSQSIPDSVRSRGVTVLTDDIAAMAAGATIPEVSAVHRALGARPGEHEATVVCAEISRIRREQAAFANAVAANWCELDEGYRPIACHGGLYTIPTVMAEAEATGASVGSVLDAIIVGYETAARFAGAFRRPDSLLHPHAGISAIGATAALAHLRGMPGEMRASSIGAAATMSAPGPWTHATAGLQIRNAWAGHGAMTAFLSLTAVQAGLHGSSNGVYEVFHDVLGSEVEHDQLDHALGSYWAVTEGYHKLYACCQYAHAAVHAALDIRVKGLPANWSRNTERIEVATHPLALRLSNCEPTTDLAARFSVPHAVAVALFHGHAHTTAFSMQRVNDPEVARLRRAVRLSLIEPLPPPPMDRPATVSVVLNNGRRFSSNCDSAPGSPTRPLKSDDILAKTAEALKERHKGMMNLLKRMSRLEPEVLSQAWKIPV